MLQEGWHISDTKISYGNAPRRQAARSDFGVETLYSRRPAVGAAVGAAVGSDVGNTSIGVPLGLAVSTMRVDISCDQVWFDVSTFRWFDVSTSRRRNLISGKARGPRPITPREPRGVLCCRGLRIMGDRSCMLAGWTRAITTSSGNCVDTPTE